MEYLAVNNIYRPETCDFKVLQEYIFTDDSAYAGSPQIQIFLKLLRQGPHRCYIGKCYVAGFFHYPVSFLHDLSLVRHEVYRAVSNNVIDGARLEWEAFSIA